MRKAPFLTLFAVISFMGCAPQVQLGEAGPPGPPGESIPSELLIELRSSLAALTEESTSKEKTVAAVSFSFGIAPPVMGFAVLTNKGNIYRMMNKNPVTIGNSFHKFVRIDERDDFTSLTALQGTDGSQQFYLAVTQSGRHYYSKDLESWTFQSVVPLPK